MKRMSIVSLVALLATSSVQARAPGRQFATATITIDRQHVVGDLPAGFLGFSFEKSALSNRSLDPDEGNFARLLNTLAPTGHLRFGGTLGDTQSWWRMPGQPVPSWARYVMERTYVDGLARLVKRTGWRVQMGVNLGHFDAANADDEARYAAGVLGPSLVGFACGNEPDLFDGGKGRDWSSQRSAWESCADVVARHGPVVGGEEAEGLRPAMLATEARRLTLATSHFYAQYDNCGSPEERRQFTLDDLLGRETVDRTTERLTRQVALARAAGLPFRLSESNSAACLKQDKVGNVFAAALWSVDFQLLAASLGVTGVNMHVPWEGWRLCSVPRTYVALCGQTPEDVARRRLTANPLYYGMLVVGSLGAGKFVATTVGSIANLRAYTVRSPDGTMRVVIVEKSAPGGTPVRVAIRGVRGTTATTQTLAAPSLTSGVGNVRFAGALVAGNGSFTPKVWGRARLVAGGYVVDVPSGTVTVVTIRR